MEGSVLSFLKADTDSTDWDKISNLYRVPSIYISYKVSVHLAKQFQRRRFLEIDQSETSIAYGGHVIH
jgi:hypothetical protein